MDDIPKSKIERRNRKRADTMVDPVSTEPLNPSSVTDVWTKPGIDVLASLSVAPEEGLDDQQVGLRLQQIGPNILVQQESVPAWRLLIKQFKSLIMALLSVAACVALWFGDYAGAIAIGVVIAINITIAFSMELSAVKAMESLQKIGLVMATVLRGGQTQQVPAEQLVPGDILIIDAGDVCPADARIIEANKLQADESSLTGESLPVHKSTEPVNADSLLAKRSSMLYRGTSVTRGSGRAVITATGTQSELGTIADLVADAKEQPTPLEKNLNTLAHKLIWVTLGITFIVTLSGTLAGKDPTLMIETGLALAVAAIPEGLPIVATIALARGMYRMAQQNALISRLASVETLGATGVICTDKTGTLTENRMTVVRLLVSDEQYSINGEHTAESTPKPLQQSTLSDTARQAIEIAVLCNNAEFTNSNVDNNHVNDSDSPAVHGDPLEVALLIAGDKLGIHRSSLVSSQPEVREEPFDSVSKMMATVHQAGAGYRVAVKGAPEEVIKASTTLMVDGQKVSFDKHLQQHWLEKNKQLASDGLRVIAVAEKTVTTESTDVFNQLILIGLIGFLDPPREDVRDSIQQCRDSGIAVVMITGDQSETAKYIGKNVSLLDESDEVIHGSDLGNKADTPEHLLKVRAFSRVSPQQKLELIELHQRAGQIVAMTGDGVNDAPALKKADIGVAMGQRGTQVAREASDMILQDDSFSTIVSAIREGRIIFSNIRLFALYLLSCNVSEVMIVGLAAIFGGALPLLPLQILFLNLVTDVFPALALGVGSGTNGMMSAKPRPATEPLLGRREWYFILFHGGSITLSVMGAFWLARSWLDMTDGASVTVSFLTLALTQLWHVFNLRETGSDLINNQVTSNRFIWLALALCLLIILLALIVPGLAQALSLSAISWQAWVLVTVASVVPLVLGQLTIYLRMQFAVKAAM